MIGLIAAILSVLAVLAKITWEARQQVKARENESETEIAHVQEAATDGDEQAVQDMFAQWRRRRGITRTPAVRLQLFQPPETEDGDGAGRNGAPQDSTRPGE